MMRYLKPWIHIAMYRVYNVNRRGNNLGLKANNTSIWLRQYWRRLGVVPKFCWGKASTGVHGYIPSYKQLSGPHTGCRRRPSLCLVFVFWVVCRQISGVIEYILSHWWRVFFVSQYRVRALQHFILHRHAQLSSISVTKRSNVITLSPGSRFLFVFWLPLSACVLDNHSLKWSGQYSVRSFDSSFLKCYPWSFRPANNVSRKTWRTEISYLWKSLSLCLGPG